MKKKIRVTFLLIICIYLFQIIFCPLVVKAGIWEDVFKKADKTVEQGKKHTQINDATGKEEQVNVIDSNKLKSTLGDIYNALLAIGIVLTVIVGAILGIKFMMSSVEEKAKIKEVMIPYIVGCIVIYGAFIIWKLIVTILDSI